MPRRDDKMNEQEPFKSILANAKMLQQIYFQAEETQKIMKRFQAEDILAATQSLNATRIFLNNYFEQQLHYLKMIERSYSNQLSCDLNKISTAIFVRQAIDIILNSTSKICYPSTFIRTLDDTDLKNITSSYRSTIKTYRDFLATVESIQNIPDSGKEKLAELPEKTQFEIKEIFKVIDTYVLSLKEKIPHTVRWLLNIALTIAIGVIINKLSQDNSREDLQKIDNLTIEMRLFRESFTQNMPKEPKGYLRKVTRRVKFTTRDNHVIFLKEDDEIFVECDINKHVYGTVVIDGKFIKGHCLKKYTKKVK